MDHHAKNIEAAPALSREVDDTIHTQRCSSCGCSWHPAVGHRFSTRTVACKRCTLHFFKWVQGHTSDRRWKKGQKAKPSFYAAALHKPEAEDALHDSPTTRQQET